MCEHHKNCYKENFYTEDSSKFGYHCLQVKGSEMLVKEVKLIKILLMMKI